MTNQLNIPDEENVTVNSEAADTVEATADNIDAEDEDMYLAMANELKDLCRDELGVEANLEFLIKGIKLRGLLYSRFLELLGTYGDDYDKLKRHGFRFNLVGNILEVVIYRSPEHVCTAKNKIVKTDSGYSCEMLSSEVRMELKLEDGGTVMISIETYDDIPHLQRIPKVLYPESFEV